MGKLATISLVKKSNARKATGGAPGKPKADTLVIQDNQDDTCTVFGVDAAGFQVDISSVASLTISSSDPSTLTVDPPVGATFTMHAVKPGSATISATATWNDGSIGPFSFDLGCTLTAGPANSIVIVPGTPVAR